MDGTTASKPRISFEAKLPQEVIDSKPTDKLQLIYWKVWTRLGLYKNEKINPPLMVSYFGVRKEIARIIKQINVMGATAMAIITVMTKKGGVGKTTIATWLGAFLAAASNLNVGIFDGDRGGGLVALRFGLDESKALSTETLVKLVEDGAPLDYTDLLELTIVDPETGLMVFHAPPGRDISESKMGRVIHRLKKNFAALLIDTGPGLRVPATNAAARIGNVRLIVGYGVSIESIEKGVKATIDYEPYRLRENLNEVLVVILGMSVRECNMRLAYDIANRCDIAPDHVAFIPYEKYMDDRIVENLKHVQLGVIPRRTKLAFANLALRVSEIAVQVNLQAKQKMSQIDTPE